MKNIEKHIAKVEMMLAISEKEKQRSGEGRFTSFEVEAIQAIVDVAETLNTLLDSMDRLISIEEED